MFCSADGNNGGGRVTDLGTKGRHLTAVVMSNAAGQVIPAFFIFEGKDVMEAWFEPLDSCVFKDKNGVPHFLCDKKWYPDDSFEIGTPSGSMDSSVISFAIHHLATHGRRLVGHNKRFVLLLDGHGSRKGVEWLDVSLENDISVVQSPANTSHFLQPCEQDINKMFQRAVRSTKDFLVGIETLNVAVMGLQLKLGIAGYKAVTDDVVKASWRKCGLWPMDYRFVDMARDAYQKSSDVPRSNIQTSFTVIQNVLADPKRVNDPTAALDEIEKAVNGLSESPEDDIQHDFLFEAATRLARERPNDPKGKNRRCLRAGAPAVYLTHGRNVGYSQAKARRKNQRSRR